MKNKTKQTTHTQNNNRTTKAHQGCTRYYRTKGLNNNWTNFKGHYHSTSFRDGQRWVMKERKSDKQNKRRQHHFQQIYGEKLINPLRLLAPVLSTQVEPACARGLIFIDHENSATSTLHKTFRRDFLFTFLVSIYIITVWGNSTFSEETNLQQNMTNEAGNAARDWT